MSADLAIGARETARLVPAGGRPVAVRPDAAHLAPETMPDWRVLLEAHWRARLERVTELSLAYHDAEAARAGHAPGARPGAPLLRQVVIERRELAEIEAALTRVGQGWFGRCERCGGTISAARLTRTPQARYCLSCETGAEYRVPRPR
jgi:RNA polymerase-binding transcription factor DksA